MAGPNKPVRRSWRWWVGLALILAVLVGAGAAAGFYYYPEWRQRRWMTRAKVYLLQKDYNSAALTVRRVLQYDDRDVAAVKLMTEIADTAGSPAVLTWRRRLMELEPQKVEHQLDMAFSALAFGRLALARDALASIPPQGQMTARYFDALGQLELASNRKAEAEAAFARAADLEPDSRIFAVNLAALRLESSDWETRDKARSIVEEFLSDPTLMRRSFGLLIDDALRQRDGAKALDLANKLRQSPEARFEDRITYLSLLKQSQPARFPGFLTDLQDEAATDKNKLYMLLSWLNSNGSALIAIEWSKRLPSKALSEMPVPVAVAQAYVVLGDWAGLKPLVDRQPKELKNQTANSPANDQNSVVPEVKEVGWESYEFMRLALLARSLRGAGQLQESSNRWNEALQSASGRPEALQILARAASDWKWESEYIAVLWTIAEGVSEVRWAVDQLAHIYFSIGSSRNFLRAVTRLYEVEPQNRWAQNNVAIMSFLLNVNVETALKLAADLHTIEPANMAYASTYAFGLHLQGRTREALEIMDALGTETLSDPAFAAYYGVILASAGSQNAGKYLGLALNGKLLPEEVKLVEDTKARLDRDSRR